MHETRDSSPGEQTARQPFCIIKEDSPMNKNRWFLIALLAILVMVLASCGSAVTPAPAAPTW
jgi:hypothetical protein